MNHLFTNLLGVVPRMSNPIISNSIMSNKKSVSKCVMLWSITIYLFRGSDLVRFRSWTCRKVDLIDRFWQLQTLMLQAYIVWSSQLHLTLWSLFTVQSAIVWQNRQVVHCSTSQERLYILTDWKFHWYFPSSIYSSIIRWWISESTCL